MSIFSVLKRHTEFIRNVLTLFTGSISARLIGLLLLPVVARLYSPADFGVAALFVAIVAVLSVISSLCYEQAIVLPQDDRDADSLTVVAAIVLIAFTFSLMLFVGLPLYYADSASPWLSELGYWGLLIPAAVLTTGITDILRARAVRRKRFKEIALSDATLALTMPGTRIALGVWQGASVGALIAGYFLGLLARFSVLVRKKELRLDLKLEKGAFQSAYGVAKRYGDFFRYQTPINVIKSLTENLPLFLLGYLYSPAVVGYYALANRLVRVPVTMASQSIRQVYLHKVAGVVNEKRLAAGPLLKTTTVLFAVGAPLFGALFFFAEDLFQLILGDNWADAGRYVEILSPWLLAALVVTPASASFVVLGKQASLFRFQLVMSVGRLGVFLVAYLVELTPEQTLGLFALVGALGNLAILVRGLRLTKTQLPGKA